MGFAKPIAATGRLEHVIGRVRKETKAFDSAADVYNDNFGGN